MIPCESLINSNFEYNLSLVLAHTLLLESKGYEPVGEAWVLNGGDAPAPSGSETTAQMLAAMEQGLPGLMAVMNSQIPANEMAQVASQQATAPELARLQTQIYGENAPELNRIGQEAARSNALAQAETDRQVLQGPGRELVREGLETARIADPEWYATRELMGTRLQEMLTPGLSGGEEEAIQRGLNRDNQVAGLGNIRTAGKTVEAGMRFGGAERDKLSNALAMATQALPTLKSGVDVQLQTTGRPSQANTGDNRFTGVQPGGAGSQTAATAGNLLNQVGENQRTAMGINSQRRDFLDRWNETTSASPIQCCFIFASAYNGRIPWFVRSARDKVYTEDIRRGYVRMSKWLVPLMERFSLVRELVNDIMIAPLTEYAGYMHNVNGYEHGSVRKPYKTFWLKVWNLMGKI